RWVCLLGIVLATLLRIVQSRFGVLPVLEARFQATRAQAQGGCEECGAQEGPSVTAIADKPGAKPATPKRWGLRRYLVAGVLVWLPILATIWMVTLIVHLMDRTLVLLPPAYRPQ